MIEAHAGKREQNREDQKTRILEAARDLFTERGVDDVTMAEVAAAAGVARATVFNHFGSKHALIEAITEGVLAFWERMLEGALADEHTPTVTLVRNLFDAQGAGIELARSFYRGVFREIAKLQLGFDEGGPGQRARENALEQLAKLLARGQERGELTRTHGPRDLASVFDSISHGTIIHWLYDDASDSLRARMRRAADVFLGPVDVRAAPSQATEGSAQRADTRRQGGES